MAKLLSSAPYFPVPDVDNSCEFYSKTLGFEVDFVAGTPGLFAICSRDGLAIMLRRVPDPERICPGESQGGTWDAFFWVDDAVDLHDEFVARKVTVVYAPVVQDYGMLEFAIRDGDGHVLGFGQTLS